MGEVNALDAGGANARSAPWPRSTTILLGLVGVVLAGISFVTVLATPSLPWHAARDLELRATYDTYRETGVLLVKENGSGSWYTTPITGPRGYAPAAWDDDPGSYLLASVMSHVTGSQSPYPGLKAAMAVLCALPLTALPYAVARLFRRARAGYVLLALPALTWLVNGGTLLIGTEYGLSDAAAPTRVYAQYGLTGALVFASLTLIMLLSTARLRTRGLVVATLGIGVLAGICNLFRSMSGVGVALAVGVLWWLASSRRARWWFAAGGAVVAVVIAAAVPTGIMRAVQHRQSDYTGIESTNLPQAHALWHAAYLGLSFPTPVNGQPSPFGIPWSDEYGWEQARAVNPDVVIQSTENDQIMKRLFLDQVQAKPVTAATMYVAKALVTITHFGGILVVIALGVGLAAWRAGPHRRRLWGAVAIAAPTLVIGLLPAVLVMPLLYYYSELSGALGLLLSVALGALAWVVTSLPSHARGAERARTTSRLRDLTPVPVPGSIGLVVPVGNGDSTADDTVAALAAGLGPQDEILVVGNSSEQNLAVAPDHWPHPCRLTVLSAEGGLGSALRAGVLASVSERLLLATNSHPLGADDLAVLRGLSDGVVVGIGSPTPAGPSNRPERRTLRSHVSEALLYSRAGDVRGPLWVDGSWCRLFAALSREADEMWPVELVLAARTQGVAVTEVLVGRSSMDRPSLRGAARLALQKDDYGQDDRVPSRPAPMPQ